jgi:starch phosphorylase
MGTRQGNNFPCLGIADQVREEVTVVGQDFDDLLEQEENPGLGNGASAGLPTVTQIPSFQ